MKVSRSLGLVAGIALVVGVSVVPAGATVVDRGHYSGTDSFTYNNCGYPVEVQSEFSGTFRVREGKNGDESAFFVSDNYSYREFHTNPDTGEWFVVRYQSASRRWPGGRRTCRKSQAGDGRTRHRRIAGKE
jgi:hypothetical protein